MVKPTMGVKEKATQALIKRINTSEVGQVLAVAGVNIDALHAAEDPIVESFLDQGHLLTTAAEVVNQGVSANHDPVQAIAETGILEGFKEQLKAVIAAHGSKGLVEDLVEAGSFDSAPESFYRACAEAAAKGRDKT